MKKKIILFGAGKIAQVVFDCIKQNSDYQVVAFTCDREFIDTPLFEGLPLIPFEEVEEHFSPSDTYCFVAIGYHHLNNIREKKLAEFVNKGFNVTNIIAKNPKIYDTIRIGHNCFIMDGNNLQPRVVLGDNVFIWNNAVIGHHSVIGCNCWIVSGANIAGNVNIGNNTYIAMNATLANDTSIGNYCFIGANSLITKNLGDEQVVIEKSNEVFRLNSFEFLRLSSFT